MPGATPQSIVHPCHIIVNHEGNIISSDKTVNELLQLKGSNDSNVSIETLFNALDLRWDSETENLLKENKEYFFPFIESTEKNTMGLRVSSLINGSTVSLVLSPEIKSLDKIEDTCVQDLPESESLFKNMFFRLKRAENKIQIYENHFPGVLFQQRADLSFNYISPNFFVQFNVDEKPLLRSSDEYLNLIAENDRSFYLKETQERAKQGKTFSLKYRLKMPDDGRYIYILDIRTPRLLSNGTLINFEGIWLDITRQSLAEQRINSVGWRETVNTLSSGLLHDFKNSITGICTLMEIYCSNLKPDHPWFEGMKMIRESALNSQKTVNKITELNREESSERAYFNLIDLVSDQASIFKNILPKQTSLEIHINSEEIPVYLPEVGFKQMILNLLMNSRDASPEHGQIEIFVESVKGGQRIFPEGCTKNTKAPKNGALIEIRDSGYGIPDYQLKQVFNPYFTTKDISKGSGLGLYNAKLFVENNSGLIAIKSIVDKGTSIFIYLPATNFTETISNENNHKPNKAEANSESSFVFLGNSDYDSLINALQDKGYNSIKFNSVCRLLKFLDENPNNKVLIALTDSEPPNEHIARLKAAQDLHKKMFIAHLVKHGEESNISSETLSDFFVLEIAPFHPAERIVWQLIELHPQS